MSKSICNFGASAERQRRCKSEGAGPQLPGMRIFSQMAWNLPTSVLVAGCDTGQGCRGEVVGP